MKAPFPYFGGKSWVAQEVWNRFGNCPNYVEPFFGSGAVLLARPDSHQWWDKLETVNDADGFIANFWRAAKYAPEEVAQHASQPVNECDLHARHAFLVGEREDISARLCGDPEWYDAKIAGWWLWGISTWLVGGWCIGSGDYFVEDGKLVRKENVKVGGIRRSRPHLTGYGNGINSIVIKECIEVAEIYEKHSELLLEKVLHYMKILCNRLRKVRVCCGDWSRVVGYTPTINNGLTAMFLDPPYSRDVRFNKIYTQETNCVTDVRKWCIENGDNPLFRIALCGYEGEGHDVLKDLGWVEYKWVANGGYGSRADNKNRFKERIWFSPHCINNTELRLFELW